MVDFQCKAHYTLDDLLHIMQLLRAPGGCPWDRAQTHQSIRRNFLEETYEVLDALDRDDPRDMCEELGDVMMQVAFHAQIEAERERLRANLLRAVGHDLRTPLTSIIGSAEAILSPGNCLSDEENRTLLRNVCSEAEWMIRMVENLLSITRVGGASYHLKKSPEMPEEVVGEVMEKFQKHFPNTTVEVEVPDVLLEVPMDAMLIEQVLYNLMENAVIHGMAEKIRIRVDAGKHWVRFSVSDNGAGIPQEKLEHLCGDYMELADTSSGDKKHNMGIGLIVCRDIIKVHGGNFEGRNQLEGGTEFWFTLPLKEERQYGGHKG